ncbi:MAG TPA: MG2 domain-containing protein, partial [Puia sp.]|nr:MG2 domain-containing protein [Puia sp.]
MRIKFLLLTTAVIITFLFSCNRNIVNLDYTNAKDEVAPIGNLVFRFDKSLVNDSLLNRWDSTEYISFEPKIPGRFRWEHPDELVFSPSKSLLPATSYRATLKNDILQFSRYGRIGKSSNISFHTPELKLENSHATWVVQDEAGSSSLPQIDLFFNYPVNPASLKEKLHIEIGGQPVEYTMQTLSADDKISLRLLNLKMEDKDYDTRIILDKGLVPEGGNNGTPDKAEINTSILSPFVLHINDITAEQDGVGGTVKVMTSQQVSVAELTGFIKFDPKVRFTVEIQEDGFLIRSDNFDIAKSYELTITKGLRGRLGGTLREDYVNMVAFGQLEPSISFANSKGIYLSGQGEKNIEAKITNVARLKLVVSKIYENNLLAAQRTAYYPREAWAGDNNGDDAGVDDNTEGLLGDVMYEKEIDTRSLPKYGNSRLLNLNIADKLPDFKGIYHIVLRSSSDYWVRDSRFISLSDIGLIAKEGKDKILVFANSIKKGTSLEGVNLLAYGANNQLLGMGRSNADGVAEIAYSRSEFIGFRPAMIIAKTADDFNYLPFNSTRVNTSRFEVGGKRSNSTGLDAFIYPERDIYRPGEKLNFSVIVRDQSWKSPGEIPMKLKFLLPNGRELKTFRKSLNEQGSLEGSIDLSPSAITGSYSLELYTSTDVLLSTQTFRIEEFVPDRIKVTAKLDKEFLIPGQVSQLSIHAVNFFGPPAANRNYECEIQVKQKAFTSKQYSNYDFSLANQTSFFDKIVRQGKTDDQGNASEKYEVPDMYKNLGMLQTNFYATVFDETGRPVSRSSSVPIYTQSVFLGVADDGYWYYPLNQKISFPIIALDKSEKPLAGIQARVEVIRHEYRTVLSRNGSYFKYESQKEDKLVASETLSITGENSLYSFIPRSPGQYELRVSLPGAGNYVSKEFYSYGSWGAENASFEVNNEGHIDIEPDKSSYYSGESVKALFKAPFSGRMLITLETDKVVSYQYVDVDKRTAS